MGTGNLQNTIVQKMIIGVLSMVGIAFVGMVSMVIRHETQLGIILEKVTNIERVIIELKNDKALK